MCMLCSLDSLFRSPIDPASDIQELRRRAASLKEDLQLFELESKSRKNRGLPPCPTTDRRIDELRQEQYEIARKL